MSSKGGDLGNLFVLLSTVLNENPPSYRLKEGQKCFDASLKSWKNNAMTLVNLGDLEREHGRYESGLDYYTQAAAQSPCVTCEGWYADWVAVPREESVAMASYMCGLMLHQLERFDEALLYLHRFEFTHRVSPAVWQQVNKKNSNSVSSVDGPVTRLQGAVSQPLLKLLRKAFSLESSFWRETDYASRGTCR